MTETKRIVGLLFVAAITLPGCAVTDMSAMVTLDGLKTAEAAWDTAYSTARARCEANHAPQTPEMEECFGDFYDAEAGVGELTQYVTEALKTYWKARISGKNPPKTWSEIGLELGRMVLELPAPARAIFERVRGVE